MKLKCPKCGYEKDVLESEFMDSLECELCGEQMTFPETADYIRKQEEEEALGDNFPTLPKQKEEMKATDKLIVNVLAQEIREFGERFVWENLDTIPLEKRLDYIEYFLSAKRLLETGEY